MNIIKYTKGINYILEGFKNNQKDIIEFVNKCKKFEDNKGFITQGFCDNNFNRAKFISGPFTNLFFDILSNQSDKIEILMGKYKTTILKKSELLYKPV